MIEKKVIDSMYHDLMEKFEKTTKSIKMINGKIIISVNTYLRLTLFFHNSSWYLSENSIPLGGDSLTRIFVRKAKLALKERIVNYLLDTYEIIPINLNHAGEIRP